MACDITSKVGTKYDVLKQEPMLHNEVQLFFDIMLLAEHYIQFLKQGTSFRHSDDRAVRLRFRVVYSACVFMDKDTHLVAIHIECMLCVR